MWSDTVTIYRENGMQVERTVCDNCRFEVKVERKSDVLGDDRKVGCFLAVPGPVSAAPGDRVVAGIGPEVTAWQQLPMDAITLTYAKPCYLQGQLHHTEAGTETSGK